MRNARRSFLHWTLAATVAGTGTFGASLAHAQADYPAAGKTIRLIVPYPAGGGTDIIARSLGAELGQNLNATVIVENKPGASGMLGNTLVAKSPADGYTILLGITALIQAPAVYPKVTYQVSDFAPVSLIARSMDVFMVPRSSGITSLKDFIAKAKADKGMSFASYGNATSSHFNGEQFKRQAGVDLVHAPYAGSGPEMAAVLGAQVSSAFVDATAMSPHLKSDKLNFLAVTGTRRHPSLPNVPTFGELGFKGLEANGWFAMFVPAKTPQPIVDKLSAEVQKIVKTPAMTKRLADMGLMPAGSTAKEMAEVIQKDTPHWAGIAKTANIQID
ncbi:ABC transporter substrate-binding protein [Comamonas serinivorans]|uniref:ABC transporter substrate-binding protein n=1 Tax=Comamonas serinivorans TaxID=1082851 RepID=A0A1Y0EJA0_9BURK|nr:tripartite tricarboxylate transporter substrate binding protein [Comamonas serinivorans]ARU03501.1 ABC transporter substrate-binding protein [Comamonas serinivorans]